MKRIFCKVLVAVMVVYLSSSVLAEEKAAPVVATGPKDTMVLECVIKGKATKAAVTLNHKKHVVDYKNKCVECHHDSKDAEGKDAKACSVTGCHDGKTEHKLSKDVGALKKDTVLDILGKGKANPYHANCLEGCHKKNKDNKKVPVKCDGCHPKEAGEKEE